MICTQTKLLLVWINDHTRGEAECVYYHQVCKANTMNTHDKNLLIKLQAVPPKPDLLNKIMFRIRHEQQKMASRSLKVRLFCSSLVTMAMAGFFVMIWNDFQAEAAQSGFLQFLSLLFSDLNSVFMNWQDFALSLLESLPFFSFTVMIAIMLVFLFSSQFLIHDVKSIFKS